MKILLNSSIVLALSVILLIACGKVDDKQSVDTAKKYFDNNQIREASLELKNALQANPKNAEARYLLGKINIIIGDFESAAKEFRKAEEAGWDEGGSKVGITDAMIRSRQFEKVLDEIPIEESYSKNTRADLFALKAFANAALGYKGLANDLIEQAKAIDSQAFHVFKAEIELKISNSLNDSAAKLLESAISAYKENTDLLILHALNAQQKKDLPAAMADLEKVISLEPAGVITFNGRKARLELVRLEILNKKLDQAISLLKPLFNQNADDPEANYYGALLSFEQADYGLAEERILKVLKVAPDHAKSQLVFGSVNFAQKDYEQAAYYINKYLQQESENIGARKLLGRTYILLGQHKDAQSTLQSGLQGSEKDAELLALIGLSQLQGGDIASGITGLEKAVAAAPDSNVLRGELTKAYISAGDTENAIKQLNTILADGGDKNQVEAMKLSAYLRAQQYDRAINVALDILKRSPEDPGVLSLAGYVFAGSGDRVEARKYFNQALKINPENIQATMLLAALEEIDGNTAEAENLYKSLINSDATSVPPKLALARLSEQKKDYTGMVSWLEDAREKAPNELRPKTILAEYYLRENKLDKVEELIKEASVISANNPTVLLLKGRMLMVQKRFNEAVTSLTELVTRTPRSMTARALLGEAYLNINQLDDARRQLKLVFEKEPYNFPVLLALAKVEQISNRYNQAVEYVEKATKVKPEQYQAYYLGGDISMSAKNYTAASHYYQKAMSIKPNSAVVIKTAEAYYSKAQPGQAINLLKQWLSNNSDDMSALLFLGNLQLSMGDKKEAAKAFESVYAEQPDNLIVLNNLAWLFLMENDNRALEFAEKAYKVAPENGEVQDTYGWILLKYNKTTEALAMLKQAADTQHDVPEVQYHYAKALFDAGNTVAATRMLKALIESGKVFDGRIDAEKMLTQ